MKSKKHQIIVLSVVAAIGAGWLGVTNHFEKIEAAETAKEQVAQVTATQAAIHELLDRMSPNQLKLENIWVEGVSPFAAAYKAADNTIKTAQAFEGATAATDKLLRGKDNADMIGWYAQVYAINAYDDHANVTFESPLGVTYQQVGIPKGSPLYNQLADSHNGEWVTISGHVVPSLNKKTVDGMTAWNVESGDDFATPTFNVELDSVDRARK